jgi:phosphoribosylformimino-5-aminoimidazole carboxamide ribonucleotide (ProFAR) isomerase
VSAGTGTAAAVFELVPSIDLRGGRVVRLLRGDDRRRTVYADDPRERLAELAAAGVGRVHLVDLDAAFGEPPQWRLLERLAAAAAAAGGPRLQLGGGLRDPAAIDRALATGFDRAVVGSLAAADPEGFARLAGERPGRLVPALDLTIGAAGEAGTLRVDGWRRPGGPAAGLAAALRGLPCPAVLVTDVERDGTLEGGNVELSLKISEITGIPVLVSGGVRSLDDLARARRWADRGLAGAVVGRALYEGAFGIAEALAVCRGEAP